MRPADLFLSFEGRLDRTRWLVAVAFFVCLVIVTHGATWRLAESGVIAAPTRDAIRAFVKIALLVPWLALDWKRFQDLGRPGRLALICPGLYALSGIWDLPALSARIPAHDLLANVIAWVQFLVALCVAYALAWLPGMSGANAYGPDPRRRAAGHQDEP